MARSSGHSKPAGRSRAAARQQQQQGSIHNNNNNTAVPPSSSSNTNNNYFFNAAASTSASTSTSHVPSPPLSRAVSPSPSGDEGAGSGSNAGLIAAAVGKRRDNNFLEKLWGFLASDDSKQIMGFSGNGRYLVMFNPEAVPGALSSAQICKHKDYGSFQRQMCIYGWRRISQSELSKLVLNDGEIPGTTIAALGPNIKVMQHEILTRDSHIEDVKAVPRKAKPKASRAKNPEAAARAAAASASTTAAETGSGGSSVGSPRLLRASTPVAVPPLREKSGAALSSAGNRLTRSGGQRGGPRGAPGNNKKMGYVEAEEQLDVNDNEDDEEAAFQRDLERADADDAMDDDDARGGRGDMASDMEFDENEDGGPHGRDGTGDVRVKQETRFDLDLDLDDGASSTTSMDMSAAAAAALASASSHSHTHPHLQMQQQQQHLPQQLHPGAMSIPIPGAQQQTSHLPDGTTYASLPKSLQEAFLILDNLTPTSGPAENMGNPVGVGVGGPSGGGGSGGGGGGGGGGQGQDAEMIDPSLMPTHDSQLPPLPPFSASANTFGHKPPSSASSSTAGTEASLAHLANAAMDPNHNQHSLGAALEQQQQQQYQPQHQQQFHPTSFLHQPTFPQPFYYQPAPGSHFLQGGGDGAALSLPGHFRLTSPQFHRDT